MLAALRYMMLAKPDKAEYEERYKTLSEWSETVRRRTIEDEFSRINSLVTLYRNMVQLVPDREVVEDSWPSCTWSVTGWCTRFYAEAGRPRAMAR